MINRWLQSCRTAFSLYSRIPLPGRADWSEETREYVLVFFPLVGVVIALLEWAWFLLCGRLGIIPDIVRALVGTVIPVLVTGGIHVDGFMDTSDALASYQSREKRLEILHDPHIGAFGVIRVLCLGAMYTAALCLLQREVLPVFLIGFVLSRTLSALAADLLPHARKDGMLKAVSSGTGHAGTRGKREQILYAEAGAALLLMILIGGFCGIFTAAAAVLVWLRYRSVAEREFGGTTGDLAGWFLCRCELAAAAVPAVYTLIREVIR